MEHLKHIKQAETSAPLHLVSFSLGVGAQDKGCKDGPRFLREEKLLNDIGPIWGKDISIDSKIINKFDIIRQACCQLAGEVKNQLINGNKVVVVGGDHSSAVGTWSGVKKYIGTYKELGLIWIDAHMDAHTPQTSESGNIHGMPLAILLGYGDPRLTQILSTKPKVKPENVCLIGVRSYEKGESQLLESLGVKVYFIEDIFERGFKVVLEEAINYLIPQTDCLGVTLDLDAIDPFDAPGVGTPESGGIKLSELIKGLALFQLYKPILTEIVEYNPYLDKNYKTSDIIKIILKTIYAITP